MPTSVPLPSLKWGKRKERSQMCEFFTVDGRNKDVELPVLNNIADDGLRAYLIDADNLYYDPDDKTWHQLINEVDYEPLQLRVDHPHAEFENIGDNLFRITSEQAQAEQYRKAKLNNAWDKIVTLFAIVFSALVVVAGIVYIT